MSDKVGRPLDSRPDRITARMLVGRGWWLLLAGAVAEREGGAIAQIKEKYGRLRIAWDVPAGPARTRCLDVSRVLKERSALTCEACGETGTLRRDLAWWKTLVSDVTHAAGAGRHGHKSSASSRTPLPGTEPLQEGRSHDV